MSFEGGRVEHEGREVVCVRAHELHDLAPQLAVPVAAAQELVAERSEQAIPRSANVVLEVEVVVI